MVVVEMGAGEVKTGFVALTVEESWPCACVCGRVKQGGRDGTCEVRGASG